MASETQAHVGQPHELASRWLSGWATARFGLVTAGKHAAMGGSAQQRRTMLAERWLLPTKYRGVYRVGHAAFVPGQREALELAACGPRAALLGWSSAAWIGLTGRARGPVRLIDPDGHSRTLPGVVRSTGVLLPHDVVLHEGLRCTSVLRTLLDMAAHAPASVVREALVEALRRGHDLEPLHALARGRRGARLLRAELELLFPQLARTLSELEARFLRLLRRHGIPLPQVNVLHRGELLDCVWPGSRLVVELDGRRWHAHRWREDLARDRRRLREGRVPFRFAWPDVVGDEEQTLADVRGVLRADGLLA